MNLYNIQKEHMALIREIELNEGELTPEIEQSLILTNQNFEEKAMSYGYVIKTFDDEEGVIKNEIERLKKLLEQKTKFKDEFKQRLSDAMIEFGVSEIKTPTLKLSFRSSEAVEIFDEDSVADEFKETKTTVTISKTKIKAAIKEGREVNGASLIKKDNLQIK